MQKQIIETLEKSNESVLEAVPQDRRTEHAHFEQDVPATGRNWPRSIWTPAARGMELVTKARGYQDLMAGQTALARGSRRAQPGRRSAAGMTDVAAPPALNTATCPGTASSWPRASGRGFRRRHEGRS